VILLAYLLFIASLQNASAGGLDKLLKNLRATQKNLVERNTELQKFSVTLEESVAKRTAELDAANRSNERRARQFEAITQISRVLNQTQNLENLLLQTTEVISRLFTFYHVGVFLLDDNNEFAVLVAANSEGGQKMLARNHKLRVGQTGIVGYVSGSALPRIALDTGSDAIYFDNPDLPETRSEMALPLLHAEKHVIGVLDVQSREPDAFGQEDLQTLAILADQVAVAIDNARLFEELQKTLQESEVFYRRGLKSGWAKFAQAQKLAGVHRSGLKTSFLEKPVELPGAFEAARTGSVYRNIDDQTKSSQLTLPMKLRDEVVGVLNIRANDNREWNDDDMDIINAIVERAALSIENARLLAESRKIAEREQVIGEISTKISAGTEIEAILRTAVRELGTQIRGAQVTVEIGGGEE
jgi:GAF domain-containing protein